MHRLDISSLFIYDLICYNKENLIASVIIDER